MGKKIRSRFTTNETEVPKKKLVQICAYDTADILRKRLAMGKRTMLSLKGKGLVCPVCGKPAMFFEKSAYIPKYWVLKCDECWTVTDHMATRYELKKAYQNREWTPVTKMTNVKRSYDPDGVTDLLAAVAHQTTFDYSYWQSKADFWDGELKAVLEKLDKLKKADDNTSSASWMSKRCYNRSIEMVDMLAESLDDSLCDALDHMDRIEADARGSIFTHGLFEDPETFIDLMRRGGANPRRKGV